MPDEGFFILLIVQSENSKIMSIATTLLQTHWQTFWGLPKSL